MLYTIFYLSLVLGKRNKCRYGTSFLERRHTQHLSFPRINMLDYFLSPVKKQKLIMKKQTNKQTNKYFRSLNAIEELCVLCKEYTTYLSCRESCKRSYICLAPPVQDSLQLIIVYSLLKPLPCFYCCWSLVK
jgi:hypothetical protein